MFGCVHVLLGVYLLPLLCYSIHFLPFLFVYSTFIFFPLLNQPLLLSEQACGLTLWDDWSVSCFFLVLVMVSNQLLEAIDVNTRTVHISYELCPEQFHMLGRPVHGCLAARGSSGPSMLCPLAPFLPSSKAAVGLAATPVISLRSGIRAGGSRRFKKGVGCAASLLLLFLLIFLSPFLSITPEFSLGRYLPWQQTSLPWTITSQLLITVTFHSLAYFFLALRQVLP